MVQLPELAAQVRSGDRRALGRAITLVESSRVEHRAEAEALLAELLPFSGGAHRIALTGPPGAGKSTLVDALGAALVASAKKVAVLAVDPASPLTSGSLLGDAVRMQRLAASEQAFIRSSSNSGVLGGIAPGTRESVVLCEAAGFDSVLIETVGVGQAEQDAADLCDTLIALTLPGMGDEVQGIKRGLFEVTDAVLVSKADGAGEQPATLHASDLASALTLLRRGQAPHVAVVSAQSGRGVAELVGWLASRFEQRRASGELAGRREQQLRRALSAVLGRELLSRLLAAPAAQALMPTLEGRVGAGELLPSAAARQLIEAAFGSKTGGS